MVGRSKDKAPQYAISTIETQVKASGCAITSMLDIEGAFNNTTKRVYFSRIVDWIDHMLANRILIIVTQDVHKEEFLSPLLWTLVAHERLKEITDIGCQVMCYSDDAVIIVRGYSYNHLSV